MFYSFFKRAWKISFIKTNIKFTWKTTGIWPYKLEKTLLIYTKKFHIKFIPKILLLNYTIYQFVKKSHLDIKDSYIQVILKVNKQFIAKAKYLEFKNKRLWKALKTEKKKQNKSKKPNLLDEKNNGLQLLLSSKI